MNLEDLIPFIIFIGYIGFAILRNVLKKKQKPQDGKSSQKPTPKKASGLSKLLNTIKAELELAGLELNQKKEKAKALTRDADEYSKAEFNEAEFGEERAVDAGFEDDDLTDDLEGILKEEAGSSIQPPEIHEGLPKFVRVVEKKRKHIVPDLPCDIKKRKQRRVPRLCASKMREAIVLSEIIAKPVGLRDEPF